MKWLLVLISLFIVGCVSPPLPELYSVETWQNYGQDRAEQGQTFQSQDKLVSLSEPKPFTDEMFQAYQVGYQEGKQNYCSQNAYVLGLIGKPYHGICDDINPFFQNDYANGRRSFF